MSRRSERVSELVREEVGKILLVQIKDPRLQGMVSVTNVDVTPDLKVARIFVSVLGTEEEKQVVLKGLEAAKGFVRRELGERLGLRYVPQVVFRMDESIERGSKILRMLKELGPESPKDGQT